MARRQKRNRAEPVGRTASGRPALRVIGGRLRGRKFLYTGDVRTRPMKQRVREAVFNLLGPDVAGTQVYDLFAGSGALAWEALSRGACHATLIERHFPTARVIRQNAQLLGLEQHIQLVTGDTFIWAQQLDRSARPADAPWTVFCSPPYDLYVTRRQPLLQLIDQMIRWCPAGSHLVVESDRRLDVQQLPQWRRWDVRSYLPAVVAVFRTGDERLVTDDPA
jgi:16S rRNA (guanine966-N2)-methyltransferase